MKRNGERLTDNEKVQFYSDGNDGYTYVLPMYFNDLDYEQLVKGGRKEEWWTRRKGSYTDTRVWKTRKPRVSRDLTAYSASGWEGW